MHSNQKVQVTTLSGESAEVSAQELHDHIKKKQGTFVFTDERLVKYPGLRSSLAKEFDALIGQRLQQEEAKDLLGNLRNLQSIGYTVELKKIPSPTEESRAKGFESGYEEGYAQAQKDTRKDVRTKIAAAAATIGGAVLAVLLSARRNNKMY